MTSLEGDETVDEAAPCSPALVADLGRPLDLLPGVRQPKVQTTHGRMTVTRDFPSSAILDVDHILAQTFCDNPEVTGILFPARESRPAPTAAPAKPLAELLSEA